MYTESIILAAVVFLLGAVISIFVAALIKGVFLGIKFRENMLARSRQEWKGATLTSKP